MAHDETKQQEAAAHRSMLHNMLGFMKKTKHIRHNPVSEGKYLSELNVDQLDPEVAALYFPSSYNKQNQSETASRDTRNVKDEDTESGNGPSLSHSPNSVEGAIGGPKSLDSDFDESKHLFENKSFGEISLSLCGGLGGAKNPSDEDFLHHIVTYEEFTNDPMLVENPNLVVRIDGKMYNWKTACPIVMSALIFQKPLPEDVTSRLCTDYMPQPTPVNDKIKDPRRSYSSWFNWGTRAPTTGAKVDENDSVTDPVKENNAPSTIPPEEADKVLDEQFDCDNVPNKKNLDLPLEMDLKRKQEDILKEQGYAGSNSSDSDSESDRQHKLHSIPVDINIKGRPTSSEKYRKTLRLSSELIAQLNLRDGANELEFSVTTAYQGTSRCKCFLFKWRYDDKIVVSDIDGTITKSDVLGHILPIVGKDWAQSGVAKLFTKIKDNGYKLLYLSARAIGQSRVTREYLKSIKQEDLSLPEGPMLLNPTSLLNAFHTEVIERKPEEFKISCLRDIQALFPTNSKPFYAGYGNKINDVWAYQAVGIPIFRIFTINHRGELKHEMTQTFQSSYSGQSCIVNDLFPPQLMMT
uniref:LNS2/PITP domain-containing protein n=3 Tax=Clastoptera arizonana TaxID=38151 RepID=A0A1B6DRR3_9HEMI